MMFSEDIYVKMHSRMHHIEFIIYFFDLVYPKQCATSHTALFNKQLNSLKGNILNHVSFSKKFTYPNTIPCFNMTDAVRA